MDNGEVPKDWRRANITAIYKKSHRQDSANFRPVSIISVSCKTLEHVIFSLFADDALIYRYLNNKEDSNNLQKDQLCECKNKWQMSFNPTKCSVMRITRKKKLAISNYIMHGQILSCAEHHPI